MYRTLLATAGLCTLLLGAGVRVDAATLSGPAIVAFFDGEDRYAAAHAMQGVVTYFNQFNMTLRANGHQYPVILHQGTIIKPRGATLAPSMVVNVEGYWSAGAFYANRIVVLGY